MKIKNSQNTHFIKITKCGLYQIKYDTIENVNLLINKILDNGIKKIDINLHSKMCSMLVVEKEL